jgi:hypothetical protein
MRLAGTGLALFVITLSACADKGDEGMFIVNNTAVTGGAACTTTGAITQPFTASGEISYNAATSGGSGYIMTPLIESRITALVGQEAQRTIHLEGANVTLTKATGGTSQNFTALFAGSLAPNGGTTNVGFELIPVSSITALGNASQNTEIVASVTVYGTLGGGRIDAEPFTYPVTILSTNNVASCKNFMFPGGANPCNAFQDGPLDCCLPTAIGATVVCPAVPE